MGKKILGIDIGHSSLKLALCENGRVVKTAVQDMPENLLKDGKIVSIETMGEMIRDIMKENGIRAKKAALVIHHENVYARYDISMPQMTEEQLRYNLPYEFRDYITDELHDYIYDFAVIDPEYTESYGEGEPPTVSMRLMAVAVSKEIIENGEMILRKAGLKLVKAAPEECAAAAIFRKIENQGTDDFCLVDMGYQSIRMYVFHKGMITAARYLEMGISNIQQVVADKFNVDIHLAKTYLMTNYQDCQNSGICESVYNSISVELMRALNFCRFSNPDSNLTDMWISGGGMEIAPLIASIREMVDMQVHDASELVEGTSSAKISAAMAFAYGITED